MPDVEKHAETSAEPTFFEIVWDVGEMIAGLTAILLPFLLLSAPAIIPLAVFTGVVLGALGLVFGALAALVVVPFLLVRTVVRVGRGRREHRRGQRDAMVLRPRRS